MVKGKFDGEIVEGTRYAKVIEILTREPVFTVMISLHPTFIHGSPLTALVFATVLTDLKKLWPEKHFQLLPFSYDHEVLQDIMAVAFG